MANGCITTSGSAGGMPRIVPEVAQSAQLMEPRRDARQAPLEHFVLHRQRHQHPQHVVVGAARKQDQALVAGARDDLRGEFGGRARVFGVLEQFDRSEEHTSELQSREKLVCRLLLEKKKLRTFMIYMTH